MDNKEIKNIMKELLKEIKNERNSLARDEFEDIFEELGKNILVIYGIGTVGKRIFDEVLEGSNCEVVAICDNGNSDKEYNGIPIYNHETVIKKFPNAKYLITIQNGYFKIAMDLIKSGVSPINIYFYDNKRYRIEKCY